MRDHATHAYPKSRGAGAGEVLGRAVRTQRHRLVEWKAIGAAPETAEFELYDHEVDPGETTNVAGAQPEVVKALRAMLAQQGEAKAVVRR